LGFGCRGGSRPGQGGFLPLGFLAFYLLFAEQFRKNARLPAIAGPVKNRPFVIKFF
jgi:hypothetical protein